MIRHFLLLPLLFFAFNSAAEKTQTVFEHSILKDIATENIQNIIITDADEVTGKERYSAKEPPGSCKGYALTLTDVREFLDLAEVTETEYEFLPKSRCITTLALTSHSGEKVWMEIERSRTARVMFQSNNKKIKLNLYCRKCSNAKFYDAVSIPSNAEAEALKQSIIDSVLEETKSGKFKSIVIYKKSWKEKDAQYSTPSFETEKMCNFDLTKTDVQEYFKTAQLWTDEQKEQLSPTRTLCYVDGEAELHNGRTIKWSINKARGGYIDFSDNPEEIINTGRGFFCGKCSSGKFYPPKWDGLVPRPVVKSVKIEKNGIPFVPSEEELDYSGYNSLSDEDKIKYIDYKPLTVEEATAKGYEYCKDYKLSKVDVIEFFKVARAATRKEYSDTYVYGCAASGEAISNGKKAEWLIKSNRYGLLWPGDGGVIYYYCHDCNPKKFESDCDHSCSMSAD